MPQSDSMHEVLVPFLLAVVGALLALTLRPLRLWIHERRALRAGVRGMQAERLPGDVERIGLAEAILQVAKRKPGQYTFDHLYYVLRPDSQEHLAVILDSLQREGKIRRVFRVEGPDGGGIADFDRLQDVPLDIHNWRDDQELHVSPENIKPVFILQ